MRADGYVSLVAFVDASHGCNAWLMFRHTFFVPKTGIQKSGSLRYRRKNDAGMITHHAETLCNA